jgi:hypothetical protein
MALVTVPANTVTKLADTANNFRVENIGPSPLRIFYSATEPSMSTDWGTLPVGNIEIRVVDGSLWGYAGSVGAVVSVFESAIPA